MADVTAKAVVNVYASTAEAVKEFNKLTDATKKYGSTLKEIEKESNLQKFIDGAAVGLAKFNLALGGAQKAFDLLNGAIDTSINQSRLANLEKMLPSGAVDRFRAATDRLIPRTQVLNLAVKGMTGDFALTEAEMQKVLKASIALEQKTGEHADVIANKLLDALAKGVNKLDDYGINLEKTGDRQADVNAAMEKFSKIIDDNPVDEQTKSLKQLKDALIEVAEAIAYVVAKAAQGIAFLATSAKKYVIGDRSILDIAPGAGEDVPGTMGALQAEAAKKREHFAQMQAEAEAQAALEAERELIKNPEELSRSNRGINERIRKRREKARAAWEEYQQYLYEHHGGPKRGGVLIGTPDVIGVPQGANAFAGPESLDMNMIGIANRPGYDVSGAGEFYGATGDQSAAIASERANKFIGQMQDRSTMLGQTWGAFTDGFEAAVNVTNEGAASMAKAFARASAASLKALAVEYAVRAIGEGAYALSSLAFHDAKGAAIHGAAALKFGLAAAAAGAGAWGLGALAGGGGGPETQPAGGGSIRGGGTSPVNGGGDTIIINIGDGFIGDPDAVVTKIHGAVREAQRKGRRTTYTTSYSG